MKDHRIQTSFLNFLLFGFLFATGIMTLPACIKKSTVSKEPPPFIVTGDTESLEEKNISAAKVDVNGDGTDDLELKTNLVKTGPGPSMAPEFVLACLHSDVAIRADSMIIPLWQKRRDTVFVSGGIKYHKSSYLTDCTTAPGATVQNAYHYAQALRSAPAATIRTSDQFMNGAFTLNKPSFSVTNPPVVQADTSYVSSYNSSFCHQLLLTGENFFCFRIHVADRDRFGYLLLEGTNPQVISKIGISR